MFGYGYDDDNILMHDTMTEGEKTVVWGSYYEEMNLFGVTCFELTGGDSTAIPEPCTLLL